jgi:sugar phosphate isomerase/epimerase
MRVGLHGAHLGYCTNIHPGETWDEIRTNVETHVLEVKRQVAPDRRFGVGLRLSAIAARTLLEPATLAAFRDFLEANSLYVFTINAFPYGPFHGQVVKEAVYRPDWLEPERLAYSDDVARVLAGLVPAEGAGSISTVPGCFRDRVRSQQGMKMLGHVLAMHAATLWRLRESGRASLGIALEPEPECAIETTAQAIRFLEDNVFGGAGARTFQELTGLDATGAEAALRHHVGLCLDACHAAVEFERPAQIIAALAAAGVRVLKLQVSAGLRIARPDRDALAALVPFAEAVYLHQVVIRRGAALTRVLDLAQALAGADPNDLGDEWRIHFHVPLFHAALGPFASTQPFLAELLALHRVAPFTDHLEVETYTWDVLPAELRGEPVADAIARELRWTIAQLEAA